MNSKKAGYLFLTQILLSIGVSLWLSFREPSFDLPIILNFFCSEAILLVPALAFLGGSGTKPRAVMSFRGLRISTVFLILLFTMLMSPLITAINAFTMIFTDNTVMAVSDDVLSQPYLIMVFIMGIYGPFCEEFVFRGAIFGSFRKTGRILGATLLQALLFGLMHLNLNQFCYAFVIGIVLGVLVEVTESLWAGFVMHAAINASNVTLLYLTKPLLDQMGGVAQTEEVYGTRTMVMMMCVYLVISVITVSIAACVLVKIAKNENREQRLYGFLSDGQRKTERENSYFPEERHKNRLVYGATILAVVLCGAYIIALEVLRKSA